MRMLINQIRNTLSTSLHSLYYFLTRTISPSLTSCFLALFVCVPLSLSLFLSLCLCSSLCVSAPLSLALPLSLSLSAFLSLPLSLSLYLSIYLSLSVPLSVSVPLSLSLSLFLSLSLSHCHPLHLSHSIILSFIQPPILSLASPSLHKTFYSTFIFLLNICIFSSLHTPFSSSLLFYLISYLLFLTSKILATLSDSVAFLDYVTAYIACLSSDRIDGLYTTVGTSILFGGY